MVFANGELDRKVRLVDLIVDFVTRDSGRPSVAEQVDRQTEETRKGASDAISELLNEMMYDRYARQLRQAWENHDDPKA